MNENLIDIATDISKALPVFKKNRLSNVAARVNGDFDGDKKIYWLLVGDIPLSINGNKELASFGQFVRRNCRVATQILNNTLGSPIEYECLNYYKSMQSHRLVIYNRSDLVNKTIATIDDPVLYKYDNINDFLHTLRINAILIKENERQQNERQAKIDELKKQENTARERGVLTKGLNKLQEEHRILTLQQEEMKNEFVNRFGLKDKCIVLHNPLDTITINKSLNAPSPYDNYKGTKFVYTARFTYNKGQDILIKAFAILRRSIPNAHLYLVGKYSDDVFFRNLKQLINENGLIESVHLVGYDQNPYRWVKYSDCFVLPSRLEGLPNSLIEAMYIGVPVVATRSIPIIDRIVQEGYNGYVVDSEDFRALADRMKDALELKNFSMTYKPASENDVVKLFSICRK